MINNDLISIIVPVYNVEKYLHRCIDSLIAQTYENIEIILIDDGSQDNCGAICDEYLKIDSRIKVVHQKNGGLSSARNAGLDMATGEYIGFVDSDDYVAVEMYEKLHSSLVNTDADIAICNLERIYEYGVTKVIEDIPIKSETLTGRSALERFMARTSDCYVVAVCKLYPKRVFNTIRFPVGKIHEDEFIIADIFLSCEKVVVVSDKLYYYTQRSDSITGTENYSIHPDYIEALYYRLFQIDGKADECFEDYWKTFYFTFNEYIKYSKYSRKVSLKRRHKINHMAMVVYRRCSYLCSLKEHFVFHILPFYPMLLKTKMKLKREHKND